MCTGQQKATDVWDLCLLPSSSSVYSLSKLATAAPQDIEVHQLKDTLPLKKATTFRAFGATFRKDQRSNSIPFFERTYRFGQIYPS